MEESILNFNKQFEWQPEIVDAARILPFSSVIVCGMGGSNLAAPILQSINPSLKIYCHRDYGLPNLDDEDMKESLIVVSSFSGNTHEVIDSLEKCISQKLNVLAIASGGKIIELARKNDIPYIYIPNPGIQPRSALGFSTLALSYAIDKKLVENLREATKLVPEAYKEAGGNLALVLKDKVPVIYSSNRNFALAYNWKIKFNETGKIPAFMNTFPELDHNELAGFDVLSSTHHLSSSLHFIFLKDEQDDERIIERMDMTSMLLRNRNFKISELNIAGESRVIRIFGILLLADWTSLFVAKFYGAEPNEVKIIEELKSMMK